MRRSSKGFTFIEIIIAIAILAVIMVVTYGALNQIIRAKKLLDDTRDSKAIADAVIGRISRELQLAAREGGALLPPPNQPKKPYPGQPKLVGSKKGTDGAVTDEITFLAQEGGQYIPDGGTHSGIVQIRYRGEKDPENRNTDAYYLIRDEAPYIRPVENAYKKLMTFPITKNLLALEFRYYSYAESRWYDSWGSPPRTKLPNIILIRLKIRSPLGTVSDYETSVFIPASERE